MTTSEGIGSGAGASFRDTKRFAVTGQLGAGGMGVVHRVYDRERGVTIALKTVTHLGPDALLRFKKEFRSLADISHKNVVQLYELFSEDDQWFFTMELVEGVDLLTWVKSSLSVPPPGLLLQGSGEAAEMLPTMALSSLGTAFAAAAGELPDAPVSSGRGGTRAPRPKGRSAVRDVSRLTDALRQLAAGLTAIHAAGKLHRDVKPSNVLVTRAGRVVLLDFGLAADREHRGRAGSEEPLVGTPAYMSPEQGAFQRATTASDWYAVGVVLYEALTGRLPFEGSPATLFLHKQHATPEPPSALVDGVPEPLERLAMDLLQIDPRARPTGDAIAARLSGAEAERATVSIEIPFVGRAAEQGALGGAFEASRAGPVVVLLRGRSGMGKTALASRFLAGLSRDPRTLVLSGRCYEREAVPFKAVDPVVDELSEWLSHLRIAEREAVLPADLPALARVFPVLSDMAARAAGGAGSPEDAAELDRVEPLELRRRAFAALRALLSNLATERRVVIHVDDLQWCDADSVELFDALLAAPCSPWLLVCAFRTEPPRAHAEPLARLLSAIQGMADRLTVLELEIGELAEREARELAAALLGPHGGELTAVVTQEAHGSPLFVAELARRAQEQRSGGAQGVGLSLQEAIQHRLAGLPEDARALLETLSVARGPLPHGLAAKAAGVDGQTRAAALSLRSARLVVTRGLGDDDPIETAHDRVRETVSARLDDAKRRACHAGLARVLAEAAAPDAEMVFTHFRAAGDTPSATRWVLLAAEASDHALAFVRAADLYRIAIELSAAPKDTLHRRLGDALANAGLLALAGDAYVAGAAHAPARTALEMRRMAAENYLKSGRDARGLEVLRAVLADVGLSYPESSERAIASILWHEGRLRLLPLTRRLRAVKAAPLADLARIDAAFAAATGLSINDPLRGADFASRGLLFAFEAGEPLRLSRALAVAAGNVASRGETARARAWELVRAAERIAKETEEPRAPALALLAAGIVSFLLGEWHSARSSLEEADRIFRERCRAVSWERANAQAWTCNVLILSGELREAAARVPTLIEGARAREDRFALTHLVYPACIARIVADDVDGALAAARLGVGGDPSLFTAARWGTFISRASIDRYRGDPAAAWALAQAESRPLEGSMLWRSAMIRIFSTYERGLSAVAAAAAGVDRAAALRATAGWAKDLSKEKLRYAPGLGHLLRAGASSVRGDKSGALEALDAALPGLDAADLRYLAACARQRKGELVGGSLGAELTARSGAFFEAQGVKSPGKCLAMSAPGF